MLKVKQEQVNGPWKLTKERSDVFLKEVLKRSTIHEREVIKSTGSWVHLVQNRFTQLSQRGLKGKFKHDEFEAD